MLLEAQKKKKQRQKEQSENPKPQKSAGLKKQSTDQKQIEAEVTQVPSNQEDNQAQKNEGTEEGEIMDDEDDWYTNMMKQIRQDDQAAQDEINKVLAIVNKPQNELYPELEPVDIFRTFKVTTRDGITVLDNMRQSQNLVLWQKPIHTVYKQIKEYDDQEKAYEHEYHFDELKLKNPKLTWAQFLKKFPLALRKTVNKEGHWRVYARPSDKADRRPHVVTLNDEYYNLYPQQDLIE